MNRPLCFNGCGLVGFKSHTSGRRKIWRCRRCVEAIRKRNAELRAQAREQLGSST